MIQVLLVCRNCGLLLSIIYFVRHKRYGTSYHLLDRRTLIQTSNHQIDASQENTSGISIIKQSHKIGFRKPKSKHLSYATRYLTEVILV